MSTRRGSTDTSSVPTIALSLLIGSLAISVLVFVFLGQERVRRTLFFPDLLSGEIHAEERIVTRRGEQRSAVRLALEEVILGPADINSSRVLPKGTAIDALFIDDRTVYVDLGIAAIEQSPDVRVNFADSVALIERNILFNFRSLKEVVVTVDGQVPYAPYFELERTETQNLENGT
jgi:hypothetical protein